MQADAKAMLDEIYQRMTDDQLFGFPSKLRLLDAGIRFIVSEAITITPATANYSAYLVGPKSTLCKDVVGSYVIDTGFMAICPDPGGPIGEDEKDTMIHEFFHAIEFTYGRVFDDYDFWGDHEPWIIEGMAEAAVKSYPLIIMQRSTYFGVDNLQKVDQLLTKGISGDIPKDEYLAQDFWVYVGANQVEDLGYLGTLLSIGGAHLTGIDRALKVVYNKSLSEFYWGWVKNQSIENFYNIGEGPGEYCELSVKALSSGAPEFFPASEQFYPFNTQSAYDILPPLTAKVIEIDFENKASALVQVEYQGCVGLQDSVAKASCEAAAQQWLRSKIYVEGETPCQVDNLPGVEREGLRRLINLTPTDHYFVVVANADPDHEHGYFIAIE
jgi:hypothetical protein